MGLKLLLLCTLLLQLTAALIIYEPAYAQGTYPTILYRQLWNNVDYTKFGKNYTIGNTNQGCRTYCSVAEANADGLFSFSPTQIGCINLAGTKRCSAYQNVAVLQALGAQAVWDTIGAEPALSWVSPGPPLDGSSVPYFWPDAWGPDYYCFLPTFETGINVTFNLEYPAMNPFERLQVLNGGLSWVRFLGLYCGIIVMLLTVFRWTTLFMIHTSIRLDIPTIILAMNFLQGAMITFNALSLNSFNGVSGDPFLNNACEFFLYWSWSITATQLILLGFYFGEVSRLTAAQGIPGLTYFRIPAAVILLLLWVVTIVVGGIDAATDSSTGGIKELSVSVYSIVWAVAGFLCIWGIVSLTIQMSGSSSKSALIRIIIVTVLIIAVFWSLGFTFLAFKNYFNLPATVAMDNDGAENLSILLLSLLIFGPVLTGILFTLLFRAQVAKEIELSKSGTSSTSGTSGSSNSSSSSSKSQDPVIEL